MIITSKKTSFKNRVQYVRHPSTECDAHGAPFVLAAGCRLQDACAPAHQPVEPRVRGVEVRPEELEAEEAHEGEDARNRRLRRVLRRDEDKNSRQQHAPRTLDHLVVVQIRALRHKHASAHAQTRSSHSTIGGRGRGRRRGEGGGGEGGGIRVLYYDTVDGLRNVSPGDVSLTPPPCPTDNAL